MSLYVKMQSSKLGVQGRFILQIAIQYDLEYSFATTESCFEYTVVHEAV